MFVEEVEAVKLKNGSLPNFLHLSFFKNFYKSLKEVWVVFNLVLQLSNRQGKAVVQLWLTMSPTALLSLYLTEPFIWVSIL